MKISIEPLPAELSATPYNTGGALCDAGQSVAWVCRVGNVTFEVSCPDDCSTWSNSAHNGPRRGMQNGTPVPKPVNAIGYVKRSWDTINGGRRWTSIAAPNARLASQVAHHLGLSLAQYDYFPHFSSSEEKEDFKRRCWRTFGRQPFRQPATEGRSWHWERHLETLRTYRAGASASRGLWQPNPPQYSVGWIRQPVLP